MPLPFPFHGSFKEPQLLPYLWVHLVYHSAESTDFPLRALPVAVFQQCADPLPQSQDIHRIRLQQRRMPSPILPVLLCQSAVIFVRRLMSPLLYLLQMAGRDYLLTSVIDRAFPGFSIECPEHFQDSTRIPGIVNGNPLPYPVSWIAEPSIYLPEHLPEFPDLLWVLRPPEKSGIQSAQGVQQR